MVRKVYLQEEMTGGETLGSLFSAGGIIAGTSTGVSGGMDLIRGGIERNHLKNSTKNALHGMDIDTFRTVARDVHQSTQSLVDRLKQLRSKPPATDARALGQFISSQGNEAVTGGLARAGDAADQIGLIKEITKNKAVLDQMQQASIQHEILSKIKPLGKKEMLIGAGLIAGSALIGIPAV